MKKFFFWSGLLICVILVSTNCENDPVSPETKNVILPLTIGNTWTYVDSQFTDMEVDTFREEIAVNGKFQNHEFFNKTHYRRLSGDPVKSIESWLINNDSEGLKLIAEFQSLTDTVLINKYIAKYPGEIGTEWESPDYNWDAAKLSSTTKITNKDVKVQAFGKNYNCIEYSTFYTKDGDLERIDYYAVNLGRVRSIFFIPDTGKYYSITLLESHIQ